MSLKIGKALSVILGDIEIQKGTRKFKAKVHYGDQYELNKWVGIQTANKTPKYPLIYYALNKDYEESEGWVKSEITLILLTDAVYSEMNNKRVVESYEKMLYPLAEKAEKILTKNPNVVVYGGFQNRFKRIDEPLMGITNSDFEKMKTNAVQGVTTDVVDALIIRFKAEINTDCV